MASQRPRRKQPSAKGYQYTGQDSHWTLQEKKQLLKAIKKYQPEDYEKIHEFIPSKTSKGIEWYISKLKASIQYNAKNSAPAPIENWHEMACDLTSTEEEDHSAILSTVMSLIAQYDNHPPKGDNKPDYQVIYSYLAALLGGIKLPELGFVESAIILDLLHGLVDVLSESDTTQQVQVMKWKYELLASKVDLQDTSWSISRTRRAIQNDFSDFTSPSVSNEGPTSDIDKQSQSHVEAPGSNTPQSHIEGSGPDASQSHVEGSGPDASQSHVEGSGPDASQSHVEGSGPDASQSHVEGSGPDASQSHVEGSGPNASQSHVEGSGPDASQSHVEGSGPDASQSHVEGSGPDASQSHVEGSGPDASQSHVEETDPNSSLSHLNGTVPVSSPSQVQVLSPGVSRSQQKKAVVSNESQGSLDDSSYSQSQVQAPEAGAFTSQSSNKLLAPSEDQEAVDSPTESQMPTKKRGKSQCDTEEVEENVIKKPKLYTVNPYCVPVNLLKLKPKAKTMS